MSGNAYGMHWIRDKKRRAIYQACGFRCAYCLRRPQGKARTLDHVFPRIHGGSNDALNLVLACRACNDEKRDRGPLVMLQGWPTEVTITPDDAFAFGANA